MGYWGYPNGQIPNDKMALYRGCLLRADAAAQAYALQDAYTRATGKPLVILEGYRDLTRQKYLRNLYLSGRGNIAAVPGLSNHGWGLACDFAAPLNSSGSEEHRWMRQNAPLFGFDWARGKADNEPWHWEYGNVPVSRWASLDVTPIDRNDMADITEGQMQRIAVILLDTEIQTPLGPRLVKHALGDALLLGQANANSIAEVPDKTWDVLVDHPLAKNEDGTPLKVRLGDVAKYEPLEHQNTRDAIAKLGTLQFTDKQLATIGAGVKPIDEASLVKKIVDGVRALFGRAAA
ncbi:tail length tape measure protein [Clavibacter phage CN1A]|uniref:Endolysin n=2 Tax=Viruses TaxID=10239 RepID=U5PT78_9CAUD|nr:tail length tape measure protein [Clavibacter phage CN1A]ACY27520.1 Lys [Clavibacter phage CN77]AGY47145.1 endolysin [Clavibacter phage CN1A]